MKSNWLVITALTSTLFLSACATDNTSDPVAQAKSNFAAQNYQLAFKEIQAPAQQGDAESQYALGYMYYYGKGTPMNHVLGKEWIKKAADSGDSNAQQAYQMIVTQEQQDLTTLPSKPTTDSTADDSASVPSAAVPVAIAPVAAPVAVSTVSHNTAIASTAALTADEHAILKAPGHEYTLQLANTVSATAAKNYIHAHHLGKAAKYYSRHMNGKTTYTVIYGHYKSRNAALAALHKLPASIQKTKPWPRTLSSVQGEIRTND